MFPKPRVAVLELRCPNGHSLGRLIKRSGDDSIHYEIHYERSSVQPPVEWTTRCSSWGPSEAGPQANRRSHFRTVAPQRRR
jgi:hypothetical protein